MCPPGLLSGFLLAMEVLGQPLKTGLQPPTAQAPEWVGTTPELRELRDGKLFSHKFNRMETRLRENKEFLKKKSYIHLLHKTRPPFCGNGDWTQVLSVVTREVTSAKCSEQGQEGVSLPP